MYREQVVFRCPWSGSTFRSKSYFAIDTAGVNCYEFLGIPAKTTARRKLHIKGDERITVDIQLPAVQDPTRLPQIPIVTVQSASEKGVVTQQRSKRTGAQEEQEPSESGGSTEQVQVRVYDAQGDRIEFDEDGRQKGNTHTHLHLKLYTVLNHVE